MSRTLRFEHLISYAFKNLHNGEDSINTWCFNRIVLGWAIKYSNTGAWKFPRKCDLSDLSDFHFQHREQLRVPLLQKSNVDFGNNRYERILCRFTSACQRILKKLTKNSAWKRRRRQQRRMFSQANFCSNTTIVRAQNKIVWKNISCTRKKHSKLSRENIFPRWLVESAE